MGPPPPFSRDQEIWIVEQFAKLESLSMVRKRFRVEFKMSPFLVPKDYAFLRVIKRFKMTGSVVPAKPKGRSSEVLNEENCGRVLDMVAEDHSVSIRQMVMELDLTKTTVWRILRQKLHLYPYKAKTVVPLTQQHKVARVEFSRWLLRQEENFCQSVVWSDEKMWEEKTRPNKQNERYWGLVDPEVEDECRVVGGKKVMCWGALVNGKVILHWFEPKTRLNQHVYLDLLKTVLWPKIRSQATRKQLWFQQDGATCHTTNMVREWLAEKFGQRVISRLTARPWPAKSPCLSPLDYWFWSVCLQELRRNPPNTLEELMETVNEYSDSLEKEEIMKAVGNILKRAECCIEAEGGAFEYKMKKAKNSYR
jgi:hypothetical protein